MSHSALTKSSRFVLRSLLGCVVVVAVVDIIDAASFRLAALTGGHAVGTDAELLRFGAPVINTSGDIAFQAYLSGSNTDVVPHGVFLSTQSGTQAFAVAGQLADGGGGARFRTPGPPIVLTDDRETFFYGNLVEEHGVTFENSYGIWAGQPTDVTLIARRGTAAPGLPTGVEYSQFVANPTSCGAMGVAASLEGPGVDDSNNTASWIGRLESSGDLTMIARTGDPAPGLANDAVFIGLGAPATNAAQQFALSAVARDPAMPNAVVTGIWGGDANNLRMLASTQSAVPGAPQRSFSDFREPSVNSLGQFTFAAGLSAETGEQYLSDIGIWTGDIEGVAPQAVAIEGEATPEFGATAFFHGSSPGEEPYYRAFSSPVLGGTGRIAFVGTVAGVGIDFEHNDGVWVSVPGELGAERSRVLVAREGDQPPGTSEGARFVGQDFGEDIISAFEAPLLNTGGQVAFEASMVDETGEMNRGIWATDRHGELRLIVRTGAQWQVGPGDSRTITLLKLHAGGSSDAGYLQAFNDAGLITYSVSFSDGTEAVIVASTQPGDTDVDGDVDLQDLNNVRNHFGGSGAGDANSDGIVDLADLNDVRNHFGEGSPAVSAPEPASWMLALLASVISPGILRRARLRRQSS